MTIDFVPTIDHVRDAAGRVAGHAVRTPLLHAPHLSERFSARVFIKPECLQRTGSFKFRGGLSAVGALGDAAKAGVVACSSGNHAQGVAEAARLAGVPATLVMPADAPDVKIAGVRRSGAAIVSYDRETERREAIAERIVEETGAALIHPYNDPHVIAGQGTVGLEIAADCDAHGISPDHVLVPCGGGGLTAGICLALTDRWPSVAVHTVEPEEFDDYRRSLASGSIERNPRWAGSVCDALMAAAPGERGFAINRKRAAEGLVVSDDEAMAAVAHAHTRLHLVAEPGGAVGLAALLGERIAARDKTVVIVISGGNIDAATLVRALETGDCSDQRAGRSAATS